MAKKHDNWSDAAKGAYRVYQVAKATSGFQQGWGKVKSGLYEFAVFAGVVVFLLLLGWIF